MGPGGKLVSDEEYTRRFGVVSAGNPWGHRVWDGMWELYDDKYIHTQRKAWHLAAYQPKFGFFRAPIHFSKKNAGMPMAFEKDFGMEYPALFFVDPNNKNFLYMASSSSCSVHAYAGWSVARGTGWIDAGSFHIEAARKLLEAIAN